MLNYNTLSIEELIKKIQKDPENPELFNELFERYKEEIRTLINVKTHNEESLKELTLSSFAEIYTNLQDYNFERPFNEWLKIIVDIVVQRDYYDERKQPHAPKPYTRIRKPNFTYKEQEYLPEAIKLIAEEKYRQIAKLAFIRKVKSVTIAKILDMKPSTVRQIKSRLKKKLKRYIELLKERKNIKLIK